MTFCANRTNSLMSSSLSVRSSVSGWCLTEKQESQEVTASVNLRVHISSLNYYCVVHQVQFGLTFERSLFRFGNLSKLSHTTQSDYICNRNLHYTTSRSRNCCIGCAQLEQRRRRRPTAANRFGRFGPVLGRQNDSPRRAYGQR